MNDYLLSTHQPATPQEIDHRLHRGNVAAHEVARAALVKRKALWAIVANKPGPEYEPACDEFSRALAAYERLCGEAEDGA